MAAAASVLGSRRPATRDVRHYVVTDRPRASGTEVLRGAGALYAPVFRELRPGTARGAVSVECCENLSEAGDLDRSYPCWRPHLSDLLTRPRQEDHQVRDVVDHDRRGDERRVVPGPAREHGSRRTCGDVIFAEPRENFSKQLDQDRRVHDDKELWAVRRAHLLIILHSPRKDIGKSDDSGR